ncbi:hypothetical protein OPT61_g8059 [Boeremia exigua]|uniref:Uncharacterized protein n=1 Tax=Boeremia exigua TaxID=749465 RepID=A0ACC2I0G1_9PLEO|nr:hypothetical protein OPT61_g8059 [Boeremia exigua]
MSFDALPTEFDNRILALLDHDSLNAMSRTSKMYRMVTEPFLYRHIELNSGSGVGIRWLVVTLLSRPELAAYTKTIKCLKTEWSSVEKDANSQGTRHPSVSLERLIDKLRITTSDTLGSDADVAKLRVAWMGAILADDHIDGSLALIASLAHNIESITVADKVRQGAITSYYGELLTLVMWEAFNHSYLDSSKSGNSMTTSQGERPFSKLHHLHLETQSPAQIANLPSLRTLHIEGWDDISVSPKFPTGILHQLQTLELIDICCNAEQIQGILSEGQATRLRSLVLRKFSPFRDSCQLIINTLIKDCPGLENLELDVVEWNDVEGLNKPLKGLASLTSLSTLRIDLDSLADCSNKNALLKLDTMLPPNLRALHVTGINEAEFMDFLEPFLDASQGHPDLDNLYQIAGRFFFKEVTITIDFSLHLGRVWAFLRSSINDIVNQLQKLHGLLLQVYGLEKGLDREPKLFADQTGCCQDISFED